MRQVQTSVKTVNHGSESKKGVSGSVKGIDGGDAPMTLMDFHFPPLNLR